MENELPSRARERQLREEPMVRKSITLAAEPPRTKLLRLKELPRLVKSITEWAKQEPARSRPIIETPLDNLEKDLRDRDDPKLMKDRTDRALPNRPIDRSDRLEPIVAWPAIERYFAFMITSLAKPQMLMLLEIREKVRSERELPKAAESYTDIWTPTRANWRTLHVLPSSTAWITDRLLTW
jgi:hypothetical protein